MEVEPSGGKMGRYYSQFLSRDLQAFQTYTHRPKTKSFFSDASFDRFPNWLLLTTQIRRPLIDSRFQAQINIIVRGYQEVISG